MSIISLSCTHPMKGFQIGLTENGKPWYKITPYAVDHVEKDNKGNWINIFDSFVSPYANRVVKEFTEIPCGHCVQCQIRASKEMAMRAMLEAKYHEDNWFLTLTYDNEVDEKGKWINLPTVYNCRDEPISHPIDYDDITGFLKRLRESYFRKMGSPMCYRSHLSDPYNRKMCKEKPETAYDWVRNTDVAGLRFIYVGEYGDKKGRPHFHVIAYGLKLDDLKEAELSHSKYGEQSNMLYESQWISNLWKKGMVRIGKVTFDSCAYVARYTMKKKGKGKPADWYEKNALTPERQIYPSLYGLGKQYYEDHKDHIYEFDQIVLGTDRKVYKAKPPRYYDRLFDIDDHDTMDAIKADRSKAGIAAGRIALDNTTLSKEDYDQMRERHLTEKLKCLERNCE